MQATSKSSDQTAHMRRLIWGFAGRTYHTFGKLLMQFIYILDIIWALTRKNLSSGVCKQQRCRLACTSPQSDQQLCYSLIGRYHIKTCSMRNFTILASLYSWAGIQGSYRLDKTKFPDNSLTFPWQQSKFPWQNRTRHRNLFLFSLCVQLLRTAQFSI